MDVNEERLKAIGHAIAIERLSKGLSQERLSAMLGHISHSHLSTVECGKAYPSLKMIFKLADALEVDVNCFFEGL